MKKNNEYISKKSKASLTACLFLLSIVSFAQGWEMSPAAKKVYEQILDLRFVTGYASTQKYSPPEIYNQSLSEALELLLNENPELYPKFEERAEKRIEQLEKKQTATSLFILAEIRLQWSIIYLKFGDELNAAWSMRQAYQLVKLCKKKHPGFEPINKTSGMLNIMVGSVPEKYEWILSLLGMEGDVPKGIKELTKVQDSNTLFSTEARLLKSLVEGYVFQHPAEGIQHISPLLNADQTPSLILILATSLSLKNAQSEKALAYIDGLAKKNPPIQLALIQYFKGEAYLQKGAYALAIASYQDFIDSYKGKNYLKDAYYKTGLCHWLNHDTESATSYFSKASTIGSEETEADKYAARSLQRNQLPNRKLTKIRYFTDGGYFDQATSVMETITAEDLKSKKDSVEFYYRKARIFHKTSTANTAIEFYKKTIQEGSDLPTYFAPNSCLQLGYLFEAKQDYKTAELYFKQALTYKKHEYKNSIDSKARSGLAQLKDRK